MQIIIRWWSWTFATHFTKMQPHETHPRIRSQIHIKKLSTITLVAEALGRLWGRSFPTPPDLPTSLGMIYVLKEAVWQPMQHAECSLLAVLHGSKPTQPPTRVWTRVRTRVRIPPSYSWNYETELPMEPWNAVLDDNLVWDRWQLWGQSRNLVGEDVVWALISEDWAGPPAGQLIPLISWSVRSYASTLVGEPLYR